MAFVLKDRVKEETTTTGTGAISLGGTSATFDQFQSYMSNGDTTYYTISHTVAGTDEWEVGVGTWNTGNTLTRTTVLAGSNGTSAVNFSAGTKDVFMTYPADKAVFKDASGNLADVSLSNFDTDDLSEGSTNQYYTDARVNSHLSGGTGVTYSDGAISIGQAVGTSDNVTFNNITSGGIVTLNADPSAALQAATKQYVDTIASAGLHYHTPVRAEHPSNLNATYNNGSSGVGATLTNAGTNAALVIDSVNMVLNDRVLVANQTDQTQNGVYTVTTVGDGSTAWVLTRSTDTDTSAPSDPDAFGKGDAFFIKEGSTNAGHLDVLSTAGTIVFGTTNIVFAEVAETTVYQAGDSLTLTGTTFDTVQDIRTTASPTFAGVTAPLTGNVTGNLTGNVTGNVTGDLTGDVTGNADTATALATARDIQLSGDVTGTVSFDGSGNVNMTTAVVDDSHAHIISNVDGLQTALDGKVATSFTVTSGNGLTGGGDLTANRTLAVGAGTGVTVNADDVAIGQDVATTASVTFGGLSVTSTANPTISIEDTDNGFAASTIKVENGGRDLDITVPQDTIFTQGSTEAMRILSDGNVGIGVSSVSGVKLDVLATASDNLVARFENNHATGSYGISVKAGDDSGNYAADFANKSGTSLMRILGDGNIGINNTSANTKLDIIGSSTNGSGVVDTLRIRNTGTTLNDGPRLQFTSGTSTSGAAIGSQGKALNSAELLFYAGGNSERLRIGSAGQIGLGGANYGTSGQVLTSNGSGSAPTWQNAGGGSNADTLDGLDSTAFLRNNVSSTMTSGQHSYQSADAIESTSGDQATLEVFQDTAGADAFMQFHVAGDYAFYFGLDGSTNNLAIGGWSLGGNKYKVWNQSNDGSGSGLDADLLDGVHGSSFLRSDADDTVNAGVTYSWSATDTEGLRFTNSSYNASLYIGGWTTANSNNISRIRNSSGNLHMDSAANGNMYLNWYTSGTVYMGSALNLNNNSISGVGDLTTNNVYMGNALLHTGDTDTYIQFATNEIRMRTANSQEVTINTTGVRLGDTGNGYFQPVSGNYGSIQIDGGAHGNWEGYNIGGRMVFMHDNGNNVGIFNDVDNEWMFYASRNSYAYMYHNGVWKARSQSYGLEVSGNVRSQSTAKVWTNFNSIGTLSVRDSLNQSSVSDLGTGYFRSNFSSNTANSSYSASGAAGGALPNYGGRVILPQSYATSSFTFYTEWQPANSYYDSNHINIVIIGD